MLHQKFYPAPIVEVSPERDLSFFHQFLNCDFDFKAAEHLKQFETILVLGTGGSSLGGQTLDCLTQGTPDIELIFLDNIDPSTFDEIMKTFDPDEVGVLAISKSGETPETLMQVFTLMHLWEKSALKEHFCIITEDKPSTLWNFSKAYDIKMLFHPKDVGGRYSIFTCVGMLIAHFLGLSPEKIHEGARKYLEKSGASESVSFLNHHFAKGKTQVVMMPYADRLGVFGSWFAQLWGESLGKQGKGTTPISAKGTTDQHSQIQLYLDGPKDKIFTFISLPRPAKGIVINEPLAPSFLKGKTMADLFWVEEMATIETLKNKNLPVRIIEIPDLREETIGALFMHFFAETVLMADLLGIDPFDQPAVEEGKILAKNYLLGEG